MSSIANALSSQQASAAASNTGTTPASKTDPLASESTFLTLLVSQLQNQDPLSPTDSNQFVSQLTSYSQLEQLIGINKNTTPATSSAPTTPTSTTSSTTPTTGTQN
jgi:flagellar basal-body rod modification protein FlgD